MVLAHSKILRVTAIAVAVLLFWWRDKIHLSYDASSQTLTLSKGFKRKSYFTGDVRCVRHMSYDNAPVVEFIYENNESKEIWGDGHPTANLSNRIAAVLDLPHTSGWA